MKSTNSLNDAVAASMELLSKLSVDLPDAMDGLSLLCIDTLLAGGKLIVLTDSHSCPAAVHLCNSMSLGSTIDRPALPSVNFNLLCPANQVTHSSELLRSISKDKDLIIVMTQKLDNIAIDLMPEQTVVITADANSHATSPTLSLGLASRDQWLLSLTFIVNVLSTQIEQRLFG